MGPDLMASTRALGCTGDGCSAIQVRGQMRLLAVFWLYDFTEDELLWLERGLFAWAGAATRCAGALRSHEG